MEVRGLHHVEMQIDVNGDGDFLDQIDFWDGSSSTNDGMTDDYFEDETQWYAVNGTSLWSQQINGYGEMYQTEIGHTVSDPVDRCPGHRYLTRWCPRGSGSGEQMGGIYIMGGSNVRREFG